jgi:hypothetical protein
MTDYSRKPYETKNLTNQRISSDFIEDSLINSFIEREAAIEGYKRALENLGPEEGSV